MEIIGPAIILNQTSTILVEPKYIAKIDKYGNAEINLDGADQSKDVSLYKSEADVVLDPVELSIFGHRFMSIAEQMGITL